MYVECHHEEGVCNWDKLFEAVREYLLCSPDKLRVLCVECHKREGKNDTSKIAAK